MRKKKKLLILLLTLALAFSNQAFIYAKKVQYSGKCGDNAYWKIKNGVMTISGTGAVTSSPWKNYRNEWKKQPKKLIVKSGITAIGDYAFVNGNDNEKLFTDGISLPDTIQSIGKRAFEEVNATSITIPKNVKSIGEYAFMFSTVQQVTIKGNLERIEHSAFSYCTNLNKITFEGEVKNVSDEVFYYCYNLQKIDFQGQINQIGKETFKNCWALKEITIPEGITVIPEQAFMKCLSLERVKLPSTLTTIEKEAFANCNRMTECSISNSVTTIKEGAFNYCAQLKQVILPESATTIEKNAFKDCYYLQSIQFPSALQEIPEGMLSGCANLESVTFPQEIKKIGKEALAGCSKLETVTIPSNVTQVEPFDQDCPKLKQIINQSQTEYSLEASSLVKKWYKDGQEVTKAGSGETVTSENRQFQIKYKKKQEGVKVKIKGDKPSTYTYGETVELPKTAYIKDYKYMQTFVLGWRYECEDKNYQTGRPVTYANTYVKTTDVTTKGNLTISPVIIGAKAVRNKKKQLVINLIEETTVYIPAQAYQLNQENMDEYHGSASFMKYEVRYATNKKMKNAKSLGIKIDAADFIIENAKKKKNYYIQVRPVTSYHPGVPITYEWSEVLKLKVK